MKKIFLLCALLLCMAGCSMPAAEDYQDFSGEVQNLTTKIDAYQDEVREITQLLEKDGIINDEIVKGIEKVNEEIDRIQPIVVDIAEAIKTAPYTGDDVRDFFIAAKSGTAASSPINPYAAPMIGILTIAEMITLLILKKKSTRLEKTNEGISKFEGTQPQEIAGKLHDIVKAKTANT